MPKDDKKIDLENLKVDPRMWMRLVMPLDDGKGMETVFKGKENPFEKDSAGAMEKVKKLASDGKLYVREFGRSRHFHKAELDKDGLQLGEQYEMKLSNGASDPVYGALLKLSRNYFRWLGFDRIADWFDRRVQRRDAAVELRDQYKVEYKSLSKDEKKELNARRKLEKLEKALSKAKQELNQVQGKNTAEEKGEMKSPLNTPPQNEQKNNTMQPTLLGDQQVQETKPLSSKEKLAEEHNVVQEDVGKEKVKSEAKENADKIMFGGVEFTKESIENLPENEKAAFQLLQAFVAKQKENEQQIAQENNLKQPKPSIPEAPPMPEQAKPPAVGENEQQPPRQPGDAGVENAQLKAPLNEPPKQEPERVNIQPEEQRAEENNAVDRTRSWTDRMADNLFAQEIDGLSREPYESIQDPKAKEEFLTGVTCGILTNKTADPALKQQAIEAFLSGRPLTTQHKEMINSGVRAYNHAVEKAKTNNRKPMEELVAGAAVELSRQASKQGVLSSWHTTIKETIGNAMKMADTYKAQLSLGKDIWKAIRGATALGDLAEKKQNARQLLKGETVNLHGDKNRDAVRDLIVSRSIERMMKMDQADNRNISNTQMVMGDGVWSVKNLQTIVDRSSIKRGITPQQVQSLLNNPNSVAVDKIAIDIGKEFVTKGAAVALENKAKQMQMQKNGDQLQQQPQINPVAVG